MTSLYERIGGAAAVEQAVDIFYMRVLDDPSLAPFFAGVPMDMQAEKQKRFLTMAFGGPSAYDGQDLRAAHKHMPLTREHFASVAGHLAATLDAFQVPEAERDEVLAFVESTKADIVEA